MKTLRVLIAVAVVFASFAFVPVPKIVDAVVGWVNLQGSTNYNLYNGLSLKMRFPTACIDNLNNPCIAFMRGPNSVYFSRYNGSTWENIKKEDLNDTNGVIDNFLPTTTGFSAGTELIFDKNNNPSIACYFEHPGYYSVHYTKWNGSEWVNASNQKLDTINSTIISNTYGFIWAYSRWKLSIDFDKYDRPYICWNDRDLGSDIFITRWDGSNWVNIKGDLVTLNNAIINPSPSPGSSSCSFPSMVLDSKDIPHIAYVYYYNLNSYVCYTEWSGSNWVNINKQVLDVFNGQVSFNDNPYWPSLQLDLKGNPNLAWSENSSLFFSKWDGVNWVNINGMILDTSNGLICTNSGIRVDLKLDKNGKPNVFSDKPFFTKWNGINWINALGVKVSEFNGLITTDVNFQGNTGYARSGYNLLLDYFDEPILFWDSQLGFSNAIFVSEFDGSFTLTKSVDTNSDGDYSDSGKQVNVGDTLKYKINWKFIQGQDPLEEPYIYDTVPEGTHYVAGSASPNGNISYSLDGGTTWITGEPPNGSPAGTQLRWDLSSLWVGAARSPYFGTASIQPMDINVSRNTLGGANLRITTDSKNYPHIIWGATINPNISDVFYVHWDGTNWVGANGSIFDPSNTNQPKDINITRNNSTSSGFGPGSICLDSSEMPHVFFGQGNSGGAVDCYYVRWNGNDWVGANNSVFVPNTSFPADINISRSGGHSGAGHMHLDKNNRPCVTWHEYFGWAGVGDMIYAKWNGSDWVGANGLSYNPATGANANITRNGGWSAGSDFDLDKNDQPHFASFDNSYGEVVLYMYWNGSDWVGANGLPYNPGSGANAIISPSPSGITGYSGNGIGIELDSNDRPHLAYDLVFSGTRQLNYIRWDGSNWVTATNAVFNYGANNAMVSRMNLTGGEIKLDKKNYPHLIYRSIANGTLHYMHFDGTNWLGPEDKIVDPNTGLNGNLSKSSTSISYFSAATFALDNLDKPHVLFENNAFNPSSAYQAIYITKAGNNKENVEFSVQVDNPPTTPAFCNEATFRHKWDNGKETLSNTVCNTIDYNFTGKFELKKSVETTGDGKYDDDGKEAKAGDKVNYKIDWSFDNPNSDPLFDAYVYDTIPEGTTYVAGSATSDMLSHSTDGGTTWIAGEPPDGAPAGTKLRWGPIPSGWVGANNKKYVPSTGANANFIKTPGLTYYPSLKLDSSGYPCIAWQDQTPGNSEIFFARWNGTQWVNAQNVLLTSTNGRVTNNNGSSFDVSLALDANGNPNIAWEDDTTGQREIYFARWDGTNWVNAQGQVLNATNGNMSNNPGGSQYVSLALDSSGKPCLAWDDDTPGNYELYYARWDGSSWVNISNQALTTTNARVTNNAGVSIRACLVLDAQDRPYIAWEDRTLGTYEVFFIKWDGTQWTNISGLSYPASSALVSQQNGRDSGLPCLKLDNNGNPCISWQDNDTSNGTSNIFFVRWNGANWVNAANQAFINAASVNVSRSTAGSGRSSLAFDKNNQPCISWHDYVAGNSEIFYVRWDGSQWIGANGKLYDPATGNNANLSRNTGLSYWPSLALDSSDHPCIAWFDNSLGNQDIYFVRWALLKLSFNFSVKIIDPFTDYTKSPICNKAEFWHVFDKGNHTISNSVCNGVYKKPEDTKKAKLSITKKAFKYTLSPKDVVHFAVEIENIGDVDAIDVNIYDYFPKELEIYHSIPKGEIGGSSIRYFLELLKAGHKRRFEVMFKVSKSAKIGKDGLYLTNIAKAFSKNSESAVEASATVVIRNDTPSGSVSMNLQMMGVDAKTGVCKKGTEISIKVDPEGGTPPYDIVVDWGDGTQSKAFNVTTDKPPTLTHTYNEVGEYTITIICTDQYGNVCKIIRKVKVE